jgi:hypothetical protein
VARDEYVVKDGAVATAIVSAGYLPLRTRVEAAGVHHRPAFAGSAVLIDDVHYEVVEERVQEEGVVYELRPWPADQILRDRVAYGPVLIAAVREERRRFAERRHARRFYWPLYPLVGALPEPDQLRWCDRWGFDPVAATRASGVVEAAFLLAAASWLSSRNALALVSVIWPFLLCACLRTLGTLTEEVAGSPLVVAAWSVRRWLRPRRPDPTLLPMTRAAFWVRLSLPDRQQRQKDGTLVVKSLLPHLTWTVGTRVPGEDMWRVAEAAAAVEGGRVVYTYRLITETDRDGGPAPDAQPPAATVYQDGVLDDVRRDWDDLRTSGFGPLISLLPAEVQERAMGTMGGPGALRGATLVSGLLELALAAWMAAAPTTLNVLTAAALAADAGVRGWRGLQGRYAPSVLGGWIVRYLRPERAAYHTHRAAERDVLMGSAEPSG